MTHERIERKYRHPSQRAVFKENTPEYRLAVALWDDIAKHGTAAKMPDMQKWADVFNAIHRLDRHPYHWIKQIMLTARDRDQWIKDNMKSPDKLRKWINTGRMDKYAPTDWMTDAEVLADIAAGTA